jgi:hypothetical protein
VWSLPKEVLSSTLLEPFSCLELCFEDVQSVRFFDSGVRSPLPGYPIPSYRDCVAPHIAAFADLGARESFRIKSKTHRLSLLQ